MQAQPQLVAQAPAGDAAPNLHDRLVFRLANANIANQCMQRTGEAASSTAALRAAVAANPNPRPVSPAGTRRSACCSAPPPT